MDLRNRRQQSPDAKSILVLGAVGGLVFLLLFIPIFIWMACRVEVPTYHMAILTKKTGKNLPNDLEIAPSEEYKGVQKEVLREGRHWINPWKWDWKVVRQVEIPKGKLGVRVRLYGDDLPYGQIIAHQENQKGIVPEILREGRHPINAWVVGEPRRRTDSYAEYIELHDPVTITAGFKGVVTELTGPIAEDPNKLLSEAGKRGVQEKTLNPETYYLNPYMKRVNLVDCRSQRFNLSSGGEMGFPSKDGFWVTLDGVIEFRVKPDQAAKVYVTYNEESNDQDGAMNAPIDEEIINKVILPNARSFCRLRGSDHSGKEFISGDTRTEFQKQFQQELEATCEEQGIEIIQALITRINPPQKIAQPVRERQIAVQEKEQYIRQKEQQISERSLAIEKETVKQKEAVVEADRQVVKVKTEAEQKQQVAIILANQQLKVAELELQAAENLAAAVMERGKADAEVIQFNNEAEAAGWKKAVEAFGGDGHAYARYVMMKKLGPAFRSMMVNTADSPIMDIFRDYQGAGQGHAPVLRTVNSEEAAGDGSANAVNTAEERR